MTLCTSISKTTRTNKLFNGSTNVRIIGYCDKDETVKNSAEKLYQTIIVDQSLISDFRICSPSLNCLKFLRNFLDQFQRVSRNLV
ncbi:hypothetical protein TYRP_019694 [Tyrophagus putrescentiae]|nr:hypothetical protein TYRP_019694 [Tyrophagus putrescentiae]